LSSPTIKSDNAALLVSYHGQASNRVRQIHVKCNAFRQKKHRHLEKNPNEQDLGVYDSPMNI